MGMASTRGATIKRRRPGVAMEMARQTSEKAQLRDGNGGSHSCSRAAPGLDRGRLGAASDRAQGGRFTCCSLARCRTARECAPLKDWRDAFVLDEQHRAGATRWAKGRNGGGGDLGGLDLRVAKIEPRRGQVNEGDDRVVILNASLFETAFETERRAADGRGEVEALDDVLAILVVVGPVRARGLDEERQAVVLED